LDLEHVVLLPIHYDSISERGDSGVSGVTVCEKSEAPACTMKTELLKEQACSIAEDHVPPAHQDEQMKKICQPDSIFKLIIFFLRCSIPA
jgi:hypothetical protein